MAQSLFNGMKAQAFLLLGAPGRGNCQPCKLSSPLQGATVGVSAKASTVLYPPRYRSAVPQEPYTSCGLKSALFDILYRLKIFSKKLCNKNKYLGVITVYFAKGRERYGYLTLVKRL